MDIVTRLGRGDSALIEKLKVLSDDILSEIYGYSGPLMTWEELENMERYTRRMESVNDMVLRSNCSQLCGVLCYGFLLVTRGNSLDHIRILRPGFPLAVSVISHHAEIPVSVFFMHCFISKIRELCDTDSASDEVKVAQIICWKFKYEIDISDQTKHRVADTFGINYGILKKIACMVLRDSHF